MRNLVDFLSGDNFHGKQAGLRSQSKGSTRST
jgi:hypothetical protein